MAFDLLTALDGKWDSGNRPAELFARHVSKHPARYLDAILEGLEQTKKKKVQNGCAELASLVSQAAPELLRPHLSRFARQLRADEPVLRWEAACTLGNLATVDREGALGRLVPQLADALAHQSIVLQGHAARALAKIARAEPKQAPRIFEALSGSSHFFPGTRAGYLVEAMEAFQADEALRTRAIAFVEGFTSSGHPPVARKAKKALRQLRASPPGSAR